MIIYHLFINGKHKLKSNSITEIYELISDLEHLDLVVSGLIENHEFHLYDSNSKKIIDILVNTLGESVL